MRTMLLSLLATILIFGLLLNAPTAQARTGQSLEQYLATIEAPQGWSLLKRDSTLAILSDNGLSSLTITIEPYQDLPLKQTALELSYQLDGSLPKWSEQVYTFTFTNPQGLLGSAALMDLDGQEWLLLILIGNEPVLLELIDNLTGL